MKKITLKKGKVIITPWLRVDEAAAHCGLSRKAFIASAKDLPHGGGSRTKLYHVDILDAWMRHKLDVARYPGKNPPAQKKASEDG